MLSLLFIVLSASCDAMCDTLVHHWYKFRWKDKVDPYWWNPVDSWKNKYHQEQEWGFSIVQISDAWHLFKTIKIGFIVLAVVSYQPTINLVVDALILGIVRNTTFSLFYNKILVK